LTAFRLPEDLTISAVVEVRALLLEAIDRGDAIELDGTAVREIDIAGLQLLCSARRQAERAGKAIDFAPGRRGPVIEAALAAAGLTRPRACGRACLCLGTAHG
jgi:hypothetical protein